MAHRSAGLPTVPSSERASRAAQTLPGARDYGIGDGNLSMRSRGPYLHLLREHQKLSSRKG